MRGVPLCGKPISLIGKSIRFIVGLLHFWFFISVPPSHPHRTQEPLKYMHIVRSVSRHSPSGWMAFDSQRRLRQAQYPDRSWAILDGELWALYMTTPAFRQFPLNSGQQNQGFRAFRGNATYVLDRYWEGKRRQSANSGKTQQGKACVRFQ